MQLNIEYNSCKTWLLDKGKEEVYNVLHLFDTFTLFYTCVSYVSNLSHPIAPDHEKIATVAAPERMKQ